MRFDPSTNHIESNLRIKNFEQIRKSDRPNQSQEIVKPRKYDQSQLSVGPRSNESIQPKKSFFQANNNTEFFSSDKETLKILADAIFKQNNAS